MTTNLLTPDTLPQHQQIEWDTLKGIISQFAYFDLNKKHLFSNIFLGQTEQWNHEYEQTQAYRTMLRDEWLQLNQKIIGQLRADEKLEKWLIHIAKNGVLNFNELNQVVKIAEAGIYIQDEFKSIQISEFQKMQLLELTSFKRSFLKEFRYLVETDGSVHLEKHPELKELNHRLRELEEKIRRNIQDWINRPDNNKSLQYQNFDIIYDRYVVPIRSDSYRSELGLIISRSDSGHTLYVEPFEIRENCNRRLEISAKIEEIINQLETKFSHALSLHYSLLEQIFNLIKRMDYYSAKASFAEKYQLNRPVIRHSPGFKISQLFHPLIKNPVKNNADLSSSEHGIVISGPNTGGKTVFLKSITICYLLFNHGFFVPALEAELFPYAGLFYFSNDLQDLESGLSSFSGEVKNYIQLFEHLLTSNLVLIDEIFNSTSSDEASALSIAFFEELHRRSLCHLIVSTHHQMFKTLVHQDQKYISCHVGFDTLNMRPTYKIQWGIPGASMAIDIFRIITRQTPEVNSVPDKALQYLNSKNISYETLLQRVSEKKIELDQLINQNRQLNQDLKNQKGAMEGVLNLKLKEEVEKTRRDLERILDEAREVVEAAKSQEILKVRKIDEKAFQLNQKINATTGLIKPEPQVNQDISIDINTLNVGDILYSSRLKKDLTVIGVDKKKMEVLVARGAVKFQLPLNGLTRSRNKNQQEQVKVSFNRNNSAKFEYDVRGFRLSEFQSLVEKAVGDLLSGDVPFINIIHGHGDGVLKNWLRNFLKNSPEFRIDQDNSGNDGSTRIVLK